MKVNFSYLESKLANTLDEGHEVLANLRALMRSGDFTLGKEVEVFEKSLAEMIGVKHALGVANGTDALRICLRMAGVGPGDEVITAANTFVASAGCVDELFATPKFVDMADNYVLDPDLIEAAITPKTKAIVPVHFTGQACDMDKVMAVANKYGIPVVEDLCQSLMSSHNGRYVGSFGVGGAISFHPLKVLSGTGDGGAIVTNDTAFYEKCKLYRNHGLIGRNQIQSPGCNSRLDTVQAIWLNYLIKETPRCLEMRYKNADYYDVGLSNVPGVKVVKRNESSRSCYHLYFIEVAANIRDTLVKFLNDHEIEARVHYPIPLQGMLEHYGYSIDNFPKAYAQSDRIVTLPVHEALTKEQLDFTLYQVVRFMNAI